MSSIPDTIERTVLVAANVQRVWALVSEPGWWINSGTRVRENHAENTAGWATEMDALAQELTAA